MSISTRSLPCTHSNYSVPSTSLSCLHDFTFWVNAASVLRTCRIPLRHMYGVQKMLEGYSERIARVFQELFGLMADMSFQVKSSHAVAW